MGINTGERNIDSPIHRGWNIGSDTFKWVYQKCLCLKLERYFFTYKLKSKRYPRTCRLSNIFKTRLTSSTTLSQSNAFTDSNLGPKIKIDDSRK